VLSSAKYPAGEIYRPYKSTFTPEDKIPFQRSETEIRSKITPPYKNLQVSRLFKKCSPFQKKKKKKCAQEKMQFYHVKNNNKMLRKNTDIAFEEGLGKLPRNLTSVASLLLFNTTENP